MNLMFVSLGCDKNLVDSEHMLSRLRKDGFVLTDDPADADAIIVNTCAFITSAKEESINTILEMAEYKKTGHLKALIVTGCLSQRYADEIRRELPEVDGIVGTNSYDEIVPVLHEVLAGSQETVLEPLDATIDDEDAGRVLTTGGFYGYLKIAEGCDKHCTYCIIPKLRGNYRSVPMVQVMKEARELAAEGVRELILVAQETTLYGTDLYGRKMLPQLLKKLSGIDGIRWIRILYAYPEEIDQDLIDAMASNPKVCHYIDMPIQHCSDWILSRMGRRTSQEDIRNKTAMLRKAMPDIAIRTTVICGFPGETEEMHEELLSFIREMKFDRLGAFAYSREEDTPAYSYPDQISEETRKHWVDDVMATQQEVSKSINEGLIGSVMPVMVEGKVADEPAYVARSYRDAPDVDGYVFVDGTEEVFNSGDFTDVEITGAYEYDLTGEPVNESSK